MISAKEAVARAAEYMREMYANEAKDLRVEEIELTGDGETWLVTMGFWEFLPVPPPVNALAALSQIENRKVRRTYKQLAIQAESGEVLSMKIRQVPGPEAR